MLQFVNTWQTSLVRFISILMAVAFVIFLWQILYYVVPMSDDLGFMLYLKKFGFLGSIDYLREQISFRFAGTILINTFFSFLSTGISLPTLLITHYIIIFSAFSFGYYSLIKKTGIIFESGVFNCLFYLSLPVNIFAGFFFFVPHANEVFFWINALFFYLTPICLFTFALGLLFSIHRKIIPVLLCIPLLTYCGGVSEIVALVFGMCLLFLLWYFKGNKTLRSRIIIAFTILVVSALFNVSGSGFFARLNYEKEKVEVVEQTISISRVGASEFFLGMISTRQLFSFLYLLPSMSLLFNVELKRKFVLSFLIFAIFVFLLSFACIYYSIKDYGSYRYYSPSVFLIWVGICLCVMFFERINKLRKFIVVCAILMISGGVFLFPYYGYKLIQGKKFYLAHYKRECILTELKAKDIKKSIAVKELPEPGVLISSEISKDTLGTNNYYLKEYLELPFEIYLDPKLD